MNSACAWPRLRLPQGAWLWPVGREVSGAACAVVGRAVQQSPGCAGAVLERGTANQVSCRPLLPRMLYALHRTCPHQDPVLISRWDCCEEFSPAALNSTCVRVVQTDFENMATLDLNMASTSGSAPRDLCAGALGDGLGGGLLAAGRGRARATAHYMKC